MFAELLGIFLKNIFIFLGPIYIKLGQLLSYNYPILNELYILQNNCPPLSQSEISYFQKKYTYLNICNTQIASGSIAVVHQGIYKDKEIVIKMKRPDIEKSINKSIWYSTLMKNILTYIPFLKCLNLKSKIEMVIKMYRSQTDFNKELENWKIYKKHNQNIINLKIPYFFEELCNEEILVMEHLTGSNIIKDKLNTDEEKMRIGHCIVGHYISGLFKGVIHGDLHCGNIAYTQDDVIIYDYGIIIELSEYEKNGMIEIINYLYLKDIDNTVDTFIKYFITKDNEISYQSIKKLKESLFIKDFNIISLFIEIKNFLEMNNLMFNDKMCYLELSFLSLSNTLFYLNVEKDVNYLINDLINSVQTSILDF